MPSEGQFANSVALQLAPQGSQLSFRLKAQELYGTFESLQQATSSPWPRISAVSKDVRDGVGGRRDGLVTSPPLGSPGSGPQLRRRRFLALFGVLALARELDSLDYRVALLLCPRGGSPAI